jgi:hypothetical protein
MAPRTRLPPDAPASSPRRLGRGPGRCLLDRRHRDALPGPSIGPGPSGDPLGPAALRLLLIDTLGPRWYCDPDTYPVDVDPRQRAIERWPEIEAENELFRAIAARLSIDPDGELTDGQKLAIYQLWKVAVSIPLESVGEGGWRFDYLAQPLPGAIEGTRTTGLVDEHGGLTIERKEPAGEPMCPICLVLGTLIDGPDGSVAVERLRSGDAVWTLDGDGRRVVGTVLAVGSTAAPRDHRVLRLTLADGRYVTASPGHPLADGRTLAELAVGDDVDGSTVATLDRLGYEEGRTFDLVVTGGTGAYLAGGIPLGSTLR